MTNSNDSSNLRNAIWADLNRRSPDDPYAWTMTHRRVGDRPLIHMPTLIIAHRFIGLQVAVVDEGERHAVQNWVPFVSATASPESLIPMGE